MRKSFRGKLRIRLVTRNNRRKRKSRCLTMR